MIFRIILILILSSSVYASECNEQLNNELAIQELAMSYIEVLRYAKKTGHNSETNPKKEDFQKRYDLLAAFDASVPERFAEAVKNLTSGREQVQEEVAEPAVEESEILPMYIYEVEHTSLLDGESLITEEWQSFETDIRGPKKVLTKDGYISFKLPKMKLINQWGDEDVLTDGGLFHLRDNYVLMMGEEGGLALLEVNDQPGKTAKVLNKMLVPEPASNLKNFHVLRVNNVNENSFMASDNRFSILFEWSESGKLEMKKFFKDQGSGEKSLLRKLNSFSQKLAFGSDILDMGKGLTVISHGQGFSLWNLQGKGLEAKYISRAAYDEGFMPNNTAMGMLKVDSKHFVSFHLEGQVVLWKIYETPSGIKKIKEVEGFANYLLSDDNENEDSKNGFLNVFDVKGQITSAQILADNYLVAGSLSGQIILFNFDLRGNSRIVNNLPAQAPTSNGRKLIYKSGVLGHTTEIIALRSELRGNKILIESIDRSGKQILWQPIQTNDFEGEL